MSQPFSKEFINNITKECAVKVATIYVSENGNILVKTADDMVDRPFFDLDKALDYVQRYLVDEWVDVTHECKPRLFMGSIAANVKKRIGLVWDCGCAQSEKVNPRKFKIENDRVLMVRSYRDEAILKWESRYK